MTIMTRGKIQNIKENKNIREFSGTFTTIFTIACIQEEGDQGR